MDLSFGKNRVLSAFFIIVTILVEWDADDTDCQGKTQIKKDFFQHFFSVSTIKVYYRFFKNLKVFYKQQLP